MSNSLPENFKGLHLSGESSQSSLHLLKETIKDNINQDRFLSFDEETRFTPIRPGFQTSNDGANKDRNSSPLENVQKTCKLSNRNDKMNPGSEVSSQSFKTKWSRNLSLSNNSQSATQSPEVQL